MKGDIRPLNYALSEKMNQEGDCPIPCVGNCGFYGSSATDYLCSKCYANARARLEPEQPKSTTEKTVKSSDEEEDHSTKSSPLIKEDTLIDTIDNNSNGNTTTTTAPPKSDIANTISTTTSTATTNTTSPNNAPPHSQIMKPKSARCNKCSRKTGLLGFTCRCGLLFCAQHRHPGDHSCSFDYRALAQDHLAKANQRVVAAKLTNKL